MHRKQLSYCCHAILVCQSQQNDLCWDEARDWITEHVKIANRLQKACVSAVVCMFQCDSTSPQYCWGEMPRTKLPPQQFIQLLSLWGTQWLCLCCMLTLTCWGAEEKLHLASGKIKAHIDSKPRAEHPGTCQRKAEVASQIANIFLVPCLGICNGLIPLHILGSSAQNGSALRREFSGGSYGAKRQPMASPSDGSLSSGGLDQGSDAPTRDYEREVSDRIKRKKSKCIDKDEEVKLCCGFGVTPWLPARLEIPVEMKTHHWICKLLFLVFQVVLIRLCMWLSPGVWQWWHCTSNIMVSFGPLTTRILSCLRMCWEK